MKNADRHDFDREMGENPLGDRVGLKAVGPYIVERYDNVAISGRSVLQVYREADGDHYRKYEQLASAFYDDTRKAADEFGSMRSPDVVEAFVGANQD